MNVAQWCYLGAIALALAAMVFLRHRRYGWWAVTAIVAVTLIVFGLASCDNRQTVHCKDGTTSSGTNVNPDLCDKHGGKK